MTRPVCWTAGLLAIALVSGVGCGRTRDEVVVDVYVAGWSLEEGGQVAKLWKSGAAMPLTSVGLASMATAVAVGEDGTVYAAGCVRGGASGGGTYDAATLWRDGVPQTLSDGAAMACAEDVAVSGVDVYVVGYDRYAPVLWTNGIAQVLPHDPTGSGDAVGVAVAGGDVYVAGWDIETTEVSPGTFLSTNVAKLWKNGVATNLSDGLSPAGARGLAVQGSEVYVVGMISPDGMIVWKNGIASSLNDGRPALATGVVVRGDDVYVSGGVNGGGGDMAAVWRNGVPQTLTTGAHQAFAEALAVSSTGVYAVGYEGLDAMLWINGAPHRLSDGIHDADALGVAVVEH